MDADSSSEITMDLEIPTTPMQRLSNALEGLAATLLAHDPLESQGPLGSRKKRVMVVGATMGLAWAIVLAGAIATLMRDPKSARVDVSTDDPIVPAAAIVAAPKPKLPEPVAVEAPPPATVAKAVPAKKGVKPKK